MAATMKDLAKHTGLGLATISKYLNGGNVREKNKALIEQAIKELDFTVNEVARSLKTRKSKTIGVLIPELNNTFITSIITVLEDVLRQKGYGIIVCDSRTNTKLQAEAVGFLLNKRVDGFIIMPVDDKGEFLQPILEKKIPVVLVDRTIASAESEVGEVVVDNFDIAHQCVVHLLQRGHQQIGLIAGPKEVSTSLERLNGYRFALAEFEMERSEALIAYGDYTIEGGYSAMNLLLDHNPDMSAVFVTNYEMTIGAILALNERKIDIPNELSLIGFDNFELARVIKPKLTIAEQPLKEIGSVVAQLLMEQLQEDKAPRKVILKGSLRIGESVKERK